MPKENKIFLSLDSDVLRAIVELDSCLLENPSYDVSTSKDFMVRENGLFFIEMLDKIKSGEVNIFVSNTIYHEVKHRKTVLNFIMQYCYFTKLNILNFDEIMAKTDSLALKYCTTSYKYKGEVFYAPLNIKFDPYTRKNIPSNDAYAMAESTLVNCIFITGNAKDLVFDKNVPNDKNSRSNGIRIINDMEGYNSQTEEGKTITPRSYEIGHFMRLIRKLGWESFEFSEADLDGMVKASDLTV